MALERQCKHPEAVRGDRRIREVRAVLGVLWGHYDG